MRDVILFLTTPSTPEREKLSLTNLRQLKKLGKDIIVLSTIPNINEEYYELANIVVFDLFRGLIDKYMYKKGDEYPIPFLKAHGSFYYYFTRAGYKIYVNTNWLAVYRNTKNLIKLAYSLNYTNFLYIEDDHYFSDYGLSKINDYFKIMHEKRLDAIYFTNVWHGSSTTVIHSHFWFGNSSYFNESIVEKLPESYNDLESQFPYTGDYESFLSYIMLTATHNKNNILLESVRDGGFKPIFGEDSHVNQIYSYYNISDDSRISLIYSNQQNLYKLIFNFDNFEVKHDPTDIKIYIDDHLYLGLKLKLSNDINMIDVHMNLESQKTIKITFGSDIVKEFKNITHKDVIKNGAWINR